MSETHAELVARAARGDAEAFGLLAEAARPWLVGLCRRLVQDQNAAEDLVQETLFLAFRDLRALRDPACFGAWLTQVARHACYGYLRRRQTHPEDAISAETMPRPEDPAPLLHVHEALARLGPRDQRLLSLFYGEGKPLSEVASELSLSSAAAKVGLHRARRRLRKEMLAMMSYD
jgi:RNA polymerase sigma-70 factor (ECF subfamily)